MTVVETTTIAARPQGNAVATQPESPIELRDSILGVISRAAADPNVDVAKMERLLDMQLKVMALASESAFNQALARLQPRLPRITKNGAIILKDGTTKIAYAKYDDICDAVLPLLAEEGFTVSYSSQLTPAGNLLEIVATFRHIDGHADSGSVFLPLVDDTGAKNRVQGAGSIYSYGKRYALCQYLNLVMEGEDDDGMQGGMKPITEQQVSQIIDLIADSKADEKKFLQYMGVNSVEAIVAKDFARAVNALNQKRRRS